MAVNSKNKGNTMERKIANRLSERFAQHTGIENSFRRNIDSGSFFGASNQKRLATHGTENACLGDVMTPETFRYTIECKHYKTPPTFTSIMKQDCKLLDEWIKQATQDAVNSDKLMLVVAKFNNVADFVIIHGKDDDAIIVYKGHSIIPFETWLTRPDTYFFA
jgi:hypothetical protein